MGIPPLIAYLLAFCMMFAVAGDNASSSMSFAVGSGVRSMREAIGIIAVFGFLGALLQGSAVQATLGGGIVGTIPAHAGLAIVITTAVWGSGLLLGFIPVSSAYAAVGASIGAGLYLHAALNWPLVFLIAFGWVFAPVASFWITLWVAWYIIPRLRLRLHSPVRNYRILSFLITAGACFQAYTLGAGRIGFATGPLSQTGGVDPAILFAVGMAGMIAGPAIVGKRFINILGKGLTRLDPGQGLAATLGSSVTDYVLTIFGTPASFDSTSFGGVLGAGSSRGLKTLKTQVIRRMILIWIVSITLSAGTAYILTYALQGLGV